MIRFIKIIESNEFSIKKTFNEIVCQSSVWIFWISLMFHSRELNRKINHIHERSLRIVYTDHNNSDLRRISLSVFTIGNIHSLAIELFKVKENFSNTIIMSDIFPSGVLNYNLISQTFLEIPSILQNLV